MGTLVIHASRGTEDPERATLPFVLGNNAAVAGQDAVILLTVEAVHLATSGGADGIHKEGLPSLREIMAEYVANGGAIWACQSCTKPRGIGQEDMIEGARIGTSMEVVELLAGGAASFSF